MIVQVFISSCPDFCNSFFSCLTRTLTPPATRQRGATDYVLVPNQSQVADVIELGHHLREQEHARRPFLFPPPCVCQVGLLPCCLNPDKIPLTLGRSHSFIYDHFCESSVTIFFKSRSIHLLPLIWGRVAVAACWTTSSRRPSAQQGPPTPRLDEMYDPSSMFWVDPGVSKVNVVQEGAFGAQSGNEKGTILSITSQCAMKMILKLLF